HIHAKAEQQLTDYKDAMELILEAYTAHAENPSEFQLLSTFYTAALALARHNNDDELMQRAELLMPHIYRISSLPEQAVDVTLDRLYHIAYNYIYNTDLEDEYQWWVQRNLTEGIRNPDADRLRYSPVDDQVLLQVPRDAEDSMAAL